MGGDSQLRTLLQASWMLSGGQVAAWGSRLPAYTWRLACSGLHAVTQATRDVLCRQPSLSGVTRTRRHLWLVQSWGHCTVMIGVQIGPRNWRTMPTAVTSP